jgi:hypothetical protein
MSSRRFFFVFFVLAALSFATPVAARADNNKTARQHLEEGFKHADKGDWEQALVQFEEAHHLDPQPTTLFDVAQARYKTGRYRSSIEAYRALLVAKASLSASQLATAQRQLAVAESKVAHLTITPKGTEPTDEITVDDQPLVAARTAAIVLDPGSHIARIRRKGNVIGEKKIDLSEGATKTIELEPAPPPPNPAAGSATIEKQPAVLPLPTDNKQSTTPALVVGGFGAALLVVGGVFAIKGYGEWSDLNGSCGSTKTCSESDVDAARRDVLIGDVGIGIGLVGIAVGTVMFIMASSGSKTPGGKDAARNSGYYSLHW